MQRNFWRKCRICFRWLRRAALVTLLAVMCVIFWFDRIGLPAFMTDRLVAALHEHGLDLEFSRMRLTVIRGLVAENVTLGHGSTRENPSASARQIALEINYWAAIHRRLQLDGLVIRNGDFFMPLSDTNVLAFTNIQTDLRWQTNDVWTLNNFKADFDGIRLGLSGQVMNGSKITKWEIFQGKQTSNTLALREQLQQFSDILHKIHFTNPTLLSLTVQGDALDIHSFDVGLLVTGPSVRTAWGNAGDLQFKADLTAPATVTTNSDASLAFWTNMLPFRLNWTLRLADVKSQWLNVQSVSAGGFWNAPVLAITNLYSQLGGGQLTAAARLNVETRELIFSNSFDFDPHVADSLLPAEIRKQFSVFSWSQPPHLGTYGSMIFPAWTNLDTDWLAAVQPTVRLNGDLAINNGAIQGVQVDSMAAEFSYSNMVWWVPLLDFEQFKTRLEISGTEDDTSKNYDWKIHGTFDPESLSSFLPPTNAALVYRLFSATEPAYLSAKVSGRLTDLKSLYATGHLACTNFAVRDQHLDWVTGDFSYTNQFLKFYNAKLWRGMETLTADEVTLDFDKKLVWFKNGYSTMDPQVVVAAIGPKTAEIMAPYVFLQPPTALINGCAPLGDANGRDDPDLRFDVIGGAPFVTHKFHATRLTGTVHWLGQHLILTNIVADLYGGNGAGGADFDFKVPHEGADYFCWTTFTNVDLHSLMSDVSGTNRLEGAFSGDIVVTSASTEDWRTVDGYGKAHLRDGLLWNVPIFGFVSKALNQVSPGLGNSRATDAGGDYTITNGVIYTDTLQINTGTTRLQYLGTVNLKEEVNARVTAQLLRNIWGVGPVLNVVTTPITKLFEYKVTGTLDDPKYEPVYVLPKILLMPLHPIQAVKGILNGNNAAQTNAPTSPSNSPNN